MHAGRRTCTRTRDRAHVRAKQPSTKEIIAKGTESYLAEIVCSQLALDLAASTERCTRNGAASYFTATETRHVIQKTRSRNERLNWLEGRDGGGGENAKLYAVGSRVVRECRSYDTSIETDGVELFSAEKDTETCNSPQDRFAAREIYIYAGHVRLCRATTSAEVESMPY